MRFALGVTNCRPAAEVAAAIERAESLGAEIAFVAEDVNCRDAFELLAVASQRTKRIRLSTGVVNPYTRNPTSIAMSIATVDELSGGRAQLGLGTSSPSLITGQMGIARGSPLEVMREMVEIVRALLAGETVSYDGSRFVYREAELEARPVQARVPIFFAAMGPRTLRLAGELADGVLLNVGASVEYIRWAVDQVAAGAESVGRDPSEVTIAAWISVYLTDDHAAGLERARRWLASMLSVPRQGEDLLAPAGIDASILVPIRERVSNYPLRGSPEEAALFVPPEVAERLTIVGNRQEVERRLGEYREAGVQVPVLARSVLEALADG
jgi:5,10-methylenetetrahydromethanopterin reductase